MSTHRVQAVAARIDGVWRIHLDTPVGCCVLTSHGARNLAEIFREAGDLCAVHAAGELDRLAGVCESHGAGPS